MEQIILDKIKLVTLQYCSEELVNDCYVDEVDISTHAHFYNNDIAMRIRASIYGQNHDEYTFSYPADWIQAFKKRWFKGWLLKKYPVRYTDKTA